jgi:hypothetical protein
VVGEKESQTKEGGTQKGDAMKTDSSRVRLTMTNHKLARSHD